MKKLLLLFSFFIFCFASERIVTLSPAVNEIVFALGEGENIVGNPDYSFYPEASKKIYKIGGYFEPSFEKIVSRKPTLVIMQKNNSHMVKDLDKFGIKSLVIEIKSLKSIKKAILDIGDILKKNREALAIVKKIEDSINGLKALPRTNKKVLIAFGRQQDFSQGIYVAGKNLYFGEVIRTSGAINALQSDRAGQPVLTLDGILSINPDIVLILSPYSKELGFTKEDIKKAWLKLPISAAKTKRVFVMDEDYSSMPSDRIVLFLDHFREIMESSND